MKSIREIWPLNKEKNQSKQEKTEKHPEENVEEPFSEPVKIPETFIEYYPLGDPHAYAAIVESKNNELKYSILEPTLTADDEKHIKEIKDILWDELIVSSKEFKNKNESEDFLKTKIEQKMKKYKLDIGLNTLDKYQYYISRDFLNFGKIDGMMKDENIEDVSCDGIGIPVFVWHRKYESIPSSVVFETKEELENFVFKLAYMCGRHISIAQPLLDGTLPDGSRAQITYGTEVTPKGSTFTIRKFKKSPLTITDLIVYNALSTEIAAYFWFLIENRHSVMIGGDIGGGKTSMLNAISLFIRPTLKIVSIEDTQEIRLPHQNWEMMVTRQGMGNSAGAIGEGGVGAISMFDLLRASLRQRPDFIIVGEIRGEEAYALFQAMATGHLGLTTIHAEHTKGVLHRLTTRPMNIPHTQVENLNAISIVRRLVIENVSMRRTISVSEMVGWDRKKNDFKLKELFKWDAESDTYKKVGKSPLLKQIGTQMGYSNKDIEHELEKREVILKYMVQKNIRTYEDVSKLVLDYFAEPDKVYRKAKVELIK
ncbi:MAG: type II/IV secretion system ATPase subunit [Candidatus Thermoplasmatota archaeon]|nr:type II/IV secretion system ATPase subunit [Candidatus Thermoplasmatota archaeon]